MEWPEHAHGTLPAGTIAVSLRHDVQHADRRLLTVHIPESLNAVT